MTRLTVRPGIPYRIGEGEEEVLIALEKVDGDPPVATLVVMRDRRGADQELRAGDRIALAGVEWAVLRVEALPRPRVDLEAAQ